MKEVILNNEEIANLNFRRNTIAQKRGELQVFEKEAQDYTRVMLERKGLDPNLTYNIDNRGVVTEVNKNADSAGADNAKSEGTDAGKVKKGSKGD